MQQSTIRDSASTIVFYDVLTYFDHLHKRATYKDKVSVDDFTLYVDASVKAKRPNQASFDISAQETSEPETSDGEEWMV